MSELRWEAMMTAEMESTARSGRPPAVRGGGGGGQREEEEGPWGGFGALVGDLRRRSQSP